MIPVILLFQHTNHFLLGAMVTFGKHLDVGVEDGEHLVLGDAAKGSVFPVH